MKKKRILFAINNFNIGGPQKSLLSLLYKLDYSKFEVNLIVLTGEGALFKYLPKKVRVIPINPIVRYATLTPKKFISNTFKYMFSENYKVVLPGFNKVLTGLIKKNMIVEKQKYWVEINHLLPKLPGFFDVAIGVSGGISMMYITDCVNAQKRVGWIRTDYRVLRRNHDIDRRYFNEMDEILSVSKKCKDIFVNIFPELSPKMKVMYNISPFDMYENIKVDTSEIEKGDAVKLLTIARIDQNKGLDLALGAIELLVDEKYNVEWFILGDGVYKNELEKLIKLKNLDNRVHLLGFEFNTAEFIKKSDIIIHPSRFEGKANAIDEAKYLHKPIVTTNFETVAEQIIDGSTGLIAEMTSQSIAIKIKELINNESQRLMIIDNLAKEKNDDIESLKTINRILEN